MLVLRSHGYSCAVCCPSELLIFASKVWCLLGDVGKEISEPPLPEMQVIPAAQQPHCHEPSVPSRPEQVTCSPAKIPTSLGTEASQAAPLKAAGLMKKKKRKTEKVCLCK